MQCFCTGYTAEWSIKLERTYINRQVSNHKGDLRRLNWARRNGLRKHISIYVYGQYRHKRIHSYINAGARMSGWER